MQYIHSMKINKLYFALISFLLSSFLSLEAKLDFSARFAMRELLLDFDEFETIETIDRITIDKIEIRGSEYFFNTKKNSSCRKFEVLLNPSYIYSEEYCYDKLGVIDKIEVVAGDINRKYSSPFRTKDGNFIAFDLSYSMDSKVYKITHELFPGKVSKGNYNNKDIYSGELNAIKVINNEIFLDEANYLERLDRDFFRKENDLFGIWTEKDPLKDNIDIYFDSVIITPHKIKFPDIGEEYYYSIYGNKISLETSDRLDKVQGSFNFNGNKLILEIEFESGKIVLSLNAACVKGTRAAIFEQGDGYYFNCSL